MRVGHIMIDTLFVLIGFFLFLFNFSVLKANKNVVGTIYHRWSSKFNLEFPLSWLRWAAIIAYLIWSLYRIINEPHRSSNYTNLFLLVIILGFYPTWHTIVGSKGIILGTKVVLWKIVKEWKIIEKGRFKYLEMKWSYESAPSDIKTKRILIPSKFFRSIENIIIEAFQNGNN